MSGGREDDESSEPAARSLVAAEAPSPGRWRRVVVWGLILLAALVTLASSLTVWVKQQVLDTDEWVDASGQLLENDEIRSALAIALTDRLVDDARLTERLAERLPEQLDPLAAPIAGLIATRAPVAAEQLLASPRAQAAWEEANRRAHERLVDLLEDAEGEAVTVDANGDVVLDVQPLVAELAARLGVDVELSPDAGRITIMRADQLAAAQDTVRVIDVLTVFLGLAVLALLALAVYLARGFRREALRGAGLALVVVGLVLLIVRRVVGDAIVEALTSDQTEPAGGAVWLIATDLLQNVAIALVAYGLIGFLGAWLAGPSRSAIRVRRALAPSLRERPLLVFSVVAVAALLALYFGPAGDTRRLFGILILGGLTLLGVEALRRQTLREFAPAVDRTRLVSRPQ